MVAAVDTEEEAADTFTLPTSSDATLIHTLFPVARDSILWLHFAHTLRV